MVDSQFDTSPPKSTTPTAGGDSFHSALDSDKGVYHVIVAAHVHCSRKKVDLVARLGSGRQSVAAFPLSLSFSLCGFLLCPFLTVFHRGRTHFPGPSSRITG